MHHSPITVAFHTVNERQQVVPLALNPSFEIITADYAHWQSRLKQIIDICKSKQLTVGKAYQEDPAIKWIHILLLDSRYLKEPHFFEQIPGSYLRPLESDNAPNKGRYDPVITISREDFLDLNTEIFSKEQENPKKAELHKQNLDTRIKFLDSSIWHRYVPEEPSPKENISFRTFLEEVLSECVEHWEEGLYYTVSAVTTLEFHLRMLKHSYIGKFGDGSHAGVVTPFKFHSERHLQRRSQLKEQDNFLTKSEGRKSLLSVLKWRMLLVDDSAYEVLSSIDKTKYPCTVNKYQLVRRPLDQLYKEFNINPIQLDLVRPLTKEGVIQFCINELRKRSFDVIFLDYLLGERPEYPSPNPKHREYGHEFLLHLIEDSRNGIAEYHRDFFGRFWIFPVSSFPFALSDKLAQLGVGHLHSIWHLSGGGDPVTTPHLYSFYLYRFLKQKVADYYLYPRALQRLINEIPNFPNTRQGALRWAKCINTTLSHYQSRLDVVEDSKMDNSQSPFLKSMADFLSKEVKIKELLDIIIRVSGNIAEGDKSFAERTQLVNSLEQTIKEQFPEYAINLSAFLEKARFHNSMSIEKALAEINKCRDNEASSLDLGSFSLRFIPEEIAELAELDDLSLFDNKLQEIPHFLEKMSGLKHLDFSQNAIKDATALPDILHELTQLETLDLRDNPITANLPEKYWHLKNSKDIAEFITWCSGNLHLLKLKEEDPTTPPPPPSPAANPNPPLPIP